MSNRARQADQHTLRQIVSWLRELAELTRPSSEPVGAEKLKAYATMLAMDLPTGAFTTESLHFAVEGQTYFPAYEELRPRLVAWWNEHRPQIAQQITDARYDRLTPDEQRWLAYWDRHVANGFEGTTPGIASSLIRRHAPRVWDMLNPGDPSIAPDAVEQRMMREWDDEDAIYARAHACRGDKAALGLLRAIVARWAPQHLDMVPEPR